MFDFGSQALEIIVKVIASIGGAVIGWFLSDPLTRVAYRLTFKDTVPGTLLVLAKMTGATALAVTMWFIAGGFSGGSGGPGFGGGQKDGTRDGVKDAVSKAKDAKPSDKKDPVTPKAGTMESIEIEIIDVKRFKNDKRYFLVNGKEPALSVPELDQYLKDHQKKIEVTPVVTRNSIEGTINPLADLLALTEQYKIKTLQKKTMKTD